MAWEILLCVVCCLATCAGVYGSRPVSYKALQVIMILYNYSKDQDYINEISLITTYPITLFSLLVVYHYREKKIKLCSWRKTCLSTDLHTLAPSSHLECLLTVCVYLSCASASVLVLCVVLLDSCLILLVMTPPSLSHCLPSLILLVIYNSTYSKKMFFLET